MNTTEVQYKKVIEACKALFLQKTKDYGTAWRIMRMPSITDQLFIKAQRIRSIQEKGLQQVSDPITDEFIGLVNYGVIALIQLELDENAGQEIPVDEAARLFDKAIAETFALQQKKNHDYGEAWREMRISSITDIILMKLMRIKQIEDNDGNTTASEGVKANYQDIINYAVFALILLEEQKTGV